jgi:hypothetical protein
MGSHLIDGKFFQSDKYPTTPLGKVPLSVKDKSCQDLLWEYAQRRRSVDAEFSDDLETALLAAGFNSDLADLLGIDDVVQAQGLTKIADALERAENHPTHLGTVLRKQIIEIVLRCSEALIERSMARSKETKKLIPAGVPAGVSKAPRETVRESLLWAATMLHLHGFMGELAVKRLRRRIEQSDRPLDGETRPLGE